MEATIRPLTDRDVDAARTVQTVAFTALHRSQGEPVTEVTPEVVERQRRRVRHFLRHDPEGAWAAVVDGAVVGVALALRRESLWGLSLLVVDPAHQSGGIGRRLLDASLTYAEGCATATILASQDPRALRSYVRAGFDLFPQIDAAGPADASRLDRPDRPIRAGVPADRELADEVDRAVRGAARGPDHEFLALSARMYVADVGSARGYAYLTAEGRVLSVTATDDATAAALLTHCLRTDDVPTAERTIEHISGEQQWAVLIAVTAGLRLASGGPVFWRGRTPPRAHLPNGAVL